MELEIREAREQDLADVLALYADAGIGGDRSISLADAKVLFERMQQYPDYTLYVAACGEEIRGTFALLIMDNLANGGLPSGVVEDVAVGRRWQGQGIGKTMMARALEVCRRRGCYKLVLSSNKRRAAAHQFYESLGFEQHGYSFRTDV